MKQELTGSVSTDVSKNIYDLAGNCMEWTMESYGTSARIRRGGNYKNNFLINSRGFNYPNYSSGVYSFRANTLHKINKKILHFVASCAMIIALI